ncbi:hypothetical protein EBB07_22900 [Paenibacillaceae bacterium]|nr:hypothetical protein EBB07_22900 [Paenibacillaceae bacterium]
MGEAYKLECDACCYKDNIFTGIGFSYIALESIASFVNDPALKEQIHKFMKDDSVTFDAYDTAYVCPHCNGIQNQLYIEMHSDTMQYKHACHCKRCGTAMEQTIIEHNVPVRLSCPDCSEGKLKATFYMDWD